LSLIARPTPPNIRTGGTPPAPSFGDPDARLLVVGLAPGRTGANRTGRPFTGDFAGVLLYETLIKTGFARGRYLARPGRWADADGLHDLQRRAMRAARQQADPGRGDAPAGRSWPRASPRCPA